MARNNSLVESRTPNSTVDMVTPLAISQHCNQYKPFPRGDKRQGIALLWHTNNDHLSRLKINIQLKAQVLPIKRPTGTTDLIFAVYRDGD